MRNLLYNYWCKIISSSQKNTRAKNIFPELLNFFNESRWVSKRQGMVNHLWSKLSVVKKNWNPQSSARGHSMEFYRLGEALRNLSLPFSGSVKLQRKKIRNPFVEQLSNTVSTVHPYFRDFSLDHDRGPVISCSVRQIFV